MDSWCLHFPRLVCWSVFQLRQVLPIVYQTIHPLVKVKAQGQGGGSLGHPLTSCLGEKHGPISSNLAPLHRPREGGVRAELATGWRLDPLSSGVPLLRLGPERSGLEDTETTATRPGSVSFNTEPGALPDVGDPAGSLPSGNFWSACHSERFQGSNGNKVSGRGLSKDTSLPLGRERSHRGYSICKGPEASMG